MPTGLMKRFCPLCGGDVAGLGNQRLCVTGHAEPAYPPYVPLAAPEPLRLLGSAPSA